MSYQIPDILVSARGFELEINPHCRVITRASEAWCLECLESSDTTTTAVPSNANSASTTRGKPPLTARQVNQKILSELKPGLLASMCYPACDYPQLRLVADLFTLLVLDNGRRLANPEDPLMRDFESRMAKAQPPTPPLYHELLQAFRVARGMPPPKSSSDSSSYDEDMAMTTYARDYSGLRLTIALIPWTVDRPLPPKGVLSSTIKNLLDAMEECMMDAIVWTWDVLGYNAALKDGITAQNAVHRLTSSSLHVAPLPLTAAMQIIGDRIAQRMEQYTKIEDEIKAQLATVSTTNTTATATTALAASLGTTAVIAAGRGGRGGGGSNMKGEEIREEVETHLHHLRSFLVGAINWAYENERWVGQKGDEVREFRWMFCEEGS